MIAKDVRRDILIVSVERIDEGVIAGQVRTMNLLYVARGHVPRPEFEPTKELRIEEMWVWTGQPWGGLPDGSSIVNQLLDAESDRSKGGTR